MTPPRLILIEDDPLQRRILADVLALDGYQVTAYAGITDGVPAVVTHPPAAVLLDVMLQDGDGLQALVQLGQRCPRVPVVVVSAYPVARTVARLQRLPLPHPGVVVVHDKGDGAEALVALLRAVVPEASA